MNGNVAVVANDGIKSFNMIQKSHLNDTKANTSKKTSAQYERAIQRSLTESDQLQTINTQLLTKVQTLTNENTIQNDNINKLTSICSSLKDLIIELSSAKEKDVSIANTKLTEMEDQYKQIAKSEKERKDKLKKLVAAQGSLDNMVNELRASVEVTKKERDELKVKCNELKKEQVAAAIAETELSTVVPERDSLKLKCNELTVERNELETKLGEVTTQRNELQDTNTNLTSQYTELQTKYTVSTTKCNDLQIKCDNIEQVLVDKEEEHSVLVSNLHDITSSLTQDNTKLQHGIDILKKDANEWQSKYEHQKELDMELDEIDHVASSIGGSKSTDDEDMLKLQKDKANEELTTKLNTVIEEKDDISIALSKANDKCTELTQKLEEEVNAKKATLHKALQLNSTIDVLTKERDGLATQLNERIVDVATAKEEAEKLASMTSERDELQAKCSDLTSERDELMSKFSQVTAEFSELTSKCNEIQQQLNTKEEERQKLLNISTESDEITTSLSREKLELEETIDMLAKDSSSWQAKYNDSQEKLKVCQSRIEEVKGSIETLKLQLSEKDKASEEISTELQQLYRESDDMSEELTSKIMALETELDQSKNEVEKLTGEMTALEDTHRVVVAGFEDEKNAVIAQIEDLTAKVESTSIELNETKETATLERMQLKTKVANLEDDLLQSKEEEERLIQSIKTLESDHEEALKRVQDEKSMAIQNLEKKM